MIRKDAVGATIVFTLVPDQTLNDFDKALQRFPSQSRQRFTRVMNVSGRTMTRRLAYTPPSFKDGRTWTSEKQFRAYFATNGFGGGIPYERTGALSAGWRHRVISYQQGLKLIIINPVPYEEFVNGRYQQIMHNIAGWARSEPVVEDEAAKLLSNLTQTALKLFDELGQP